MNVGSWWADLGGTLIGTGVGFFLAMLWDRRRDRNQEARERASSMQSILLNLEDIEERLHFPTYEEAKGSKHSRRLRVILDKPYIGRAPFDAAVASGRLVLFPPELQERLSTTYELVRQVHMHLDVMNTAYSRPGGAEEHAAIMGNALEHYSLDAPIAKDMIQRAIAELRQVLEIKPPPVRLPKPPGEREAMNPDL